MSYELFTPPASLPVSVEQAKAQLRELSSDQDDRIAALIGRAARHVESQCGVQLMPAGWRLRLDAFPRCRGVIEIRKPPVTAVDSITYVDAAGVTQTLDPAVWESDVWSAPARVAPVWGSSWPQTARSLGAVTVEFSAGYADADAVPDAAVQAVLLLVEAWYGEAPDSVRTVYSAVAPGSLDALLNDLRWAAHA